VSDSDVSEKEDDKKNDGKSDGPGAPEKAKEKVEVVEDEEGSEEPSKSKKVVAKLVPAAQVAAEKEEVLAKTRDGVPLIVSGCKNKTICEIVKGTFFRHGSNHSKPVYKKKTEKKKEEDDLDVLIYYWDERDGAENCGWWFGPVVGGEMVWAYHPSRKATTPPPAEWNVPHDGDIDFTFSVTADPAAFATKGRGEEDSKEAEEEDDEDEDEEEDEPEVKGKANEPETKPTDRSKGKASEEAKAAESLKTAAEGDGKGAPASTQAYLVDAYKRRREERAKAEAEAKRKAEEEEDSESEEKEELNELEKQEAEDKRIMEELRLRQEARQKKAEELKQKKEMAKKEKEKSKEDKKKEEDKRRAEEEEEERRLKRRREEEARGEEEEKERKRKVRDEERRREENEKRRRKEEEDRRREEEEKERERDRAKREEERRREDERRKEEDEREERRRRQERQRDEEERAKQREAKEVERKRQEERLQRKMEQKRREEEEAAKQMVDEEQLARDRAAREQQLAKERAEREEQLAREKAEREKAAKLRRQQEATMSIVQGLQSLSDVTPDNIQAKLSAFEQLLQTELPETGDQQENLKGEADRVIEYAKQYVKQLEEKERQAKEQEAKRLEELREKEQRVRAVFGELEKLLLAAEEEATQAQQATERLLQVSAQQFPPPPPPATKESGLPETLQSMLPHGSEDGLRASEASKRAGELASAAIDVFQKFFEENQTALMEAETLREEVAQGLQRMDARLQQARSLSAEAVKAAGNTKERLQSSAAIIISAAKTSETFKKYDEDQDGMLSRAEVVKFAKLEFGFNLPSANLDRIFHQLAAGTSGVIQTRFQQLRTAIGIARWETRCKMKQQPAEEQAETEKELEKCEAEHREHLKKQWESVSSELQTLDLPGLGTQLQETESISGKFTAEASSFKPWQKDSGQQTLPTLAEDLDKSLSKSRSLLSTCLEKLRCLRQAAVQIKLKLGELKDKEKNIDTAELHENLKVAADALAGVEARLRRVEKGSAEGQKVLVDLEYQKSQDQRLEVAEKLRSCIQQLGGKAVDLFQIIAKGGDAASAQETLAFLKENNCELDSDRLNGVFSAHCSPKESGDLLASREEFARIIRIFYKVQQETNLLDGQEGEAVRALEPSEILEVQSGPVTVGEAKRIQARALKDNSLGWITVSAGGTDYLTRGRTLLQVVRPTGLEGGQEGASRILQEEEILEVLDWTRSRTDASGSTIFRVRARQDGLVGWVALNDAVQSV